MKSIVVMVILYYDHKAISASHGIIASFKQSLTLTGKLHNIQRTLEDISAGCIVLMDMMEADKKLIHYWQDNLRQKTIT